MRAPDQQSATSVRCPRGRLPLRLR